MYYLHLYLYLAKVKLQGVIEHRAAFLWTALSQAISYGVEFLLLWVVIDQFETIGGWESYEVLFLYALNLASYAVAGFFLFMPHWWLPFLVQSGDFDEVLTRPLHPLLYLIFREFHYGYVSHLALSILVVIISVCRLGLSLNVFNVFFLITVTLGGALIHGAAFLFVSVPVFWVIRNDGMRSILGNLRRVIQYPISIYHGAAQVFLTFIVPYAFINYYPAQLFLSKEGFSIFHPAFQYLTPLVGVAAFALAYWFWSVGVKHYESTGS